MFGKVLKKILYMGFRATLSFRKFKNTQNTPININFVRHENYNFLDCDWFKKLIFSTYSLVKFSSL